MELLKEHEKVILAHWTYTRQEWWSFIRWTKKRKGFLHFVLHFFSRNSKKVIPEVRITPERVWIDNDHQHFISKEHQLKRIDIRDEDCGNIMEITYHWSKNNSTSLNEIHIPVPKGKLKEAIEVEERLNNDLESRNS